MLSIFFSLLAYVFWMIPMADVWRFRLKKKKKKKTRLRFKLYLMLIGVHLLLKAINHGRAIVFLENKPKLTTTKSLPQLRSEWIVFSTSLIHVHQQVCWKKKRYENEFVGMFGERDYSSPWNTPNVRFRFCRRKKQTNGLNLIANRQHHKYCLLLHYLLL
jgi:hypothetical protein